MTKNTPAPIYTHDFVDAAALSLEAAKGLLSVLQTATEPNADSTLQPHEFAATSKSLREAWLGKQDRTNNQLQVAIIHSHGRLAGEALAYINSFDGTKAV